MRKFLQIEQVLTDLQTTVGNFTFSIAKFFFFFGFVIRTFPSGKLFFSNFTSGTELS